MKIYQSYETKISFILWVSCFNLVQKQGNPWKKTNSLALYGFNNEYYFLIPLSKENNLIYLRSSEWGKHDKQQQISSSGVVLSFVF